MKMKKNKKYNIYEHKDGEVINTSGRQFTLNGIL